MTAVLSLQWRMVRDAPIMLYSAYLIDHLKLIPYRDIFDVNMIGAYFINVLVGRFFGYGDLGFRLADLLWLACILVVTWLTVKEFGWKMAWSATLSFGLSYLHYGPTQSLQRDFLLVLPLAGGLLATIYYSKSKNSVYLIVLGFLVGIAATIKPQSAIAFPIFLGYSLWEAKSRTDKTTSLFKLSLFAIAGLSIPGIVAFCYLWWSGGLAPFLDIVLNYLPLYGQVSLMNGNFQILTGASRISYLAGGLILFGGYALWIVPAVAGTYIALFCAPFSPSQKRQAMLFFALAVCYAIYPVIGGQFTYYSYFPFLYFVGLTSSLIFAQGSASRQWVHKATIWLAQIAFMVTLVVDAAPPREFFLQISGLQLEPPNSGRVDEIAEYLSAHLREGDTVQPLDWTGGAVHAMLIAQAQIATPFIHDVHFYRTVSEPYIQTLRRRFIDDLTASSPRYIIQIRTDKPWLSGPDTTTTFDELQRVLDVGYSAAFQGDGYTIFERNSPMSSDSN